MAASSVSSLSYARHMNAWTVQGHALFDRAMQVVQSVVEERPDRFVQVYKEYRSAYEALKLPMVTQLREWGPTFAQSQPDIYGVVYQSYVAFKIYNRMIKRSLGEEQLKQIVPKMEDALRCGQLWDEMQRKQPSKEGAKISYDSYLSLKTELKLLSLCPLVQGVAQRVLNKIQEYRAQRVKKGEKEDFFPELYAYSLPVIVAHAKAKGGEAECQWIAQQAFRQLEELRTKLPGAAAASWLIAVSECQINKVVSLPPSPCKKALAEDSDDWATFLRRLNRRLGKNQLDGCTKETAAERIDALSKEEFAAVFKLFYQEPSPLSMATLEQMERNATSGHFKQWLLLKCAEKGISEGDLAGGVRSMLLLCEEISLDETPHIPPGLKTVIDQLAEEILQVPECLSLIFGDGFCRIPNLLLSDDPKRGLLDDAMGSMVQRLFDQGYQQYALALIDAIIDVEAAEGVRKGLTWDLQLVLNVEGDSV